MNHEPSNDLYDVCIVGAGPSGSTCAYYLARQGQRVLLLEKEKFPRDKLCGDAVCSRALFHLEKMGVLQEIVAEYRGNWAKVGGFVSPSGITFIGDSAQHTGTPLVMAIARIVLDEKIARAAAAAGANLIEQSPVTKAEFSSDSGCWQIYCGENYYRARVLIAADEATSRLARSLGLVQTPADAVCSRAYIDADTSDFKADGVVFYPPSLLPGYCALFREAENKLNFCCYIIPGGRCVPADLGKMHYMLMKEDPHVSKAIGPHAKMERMKGAPLRLGGIPQSYADHLLILGDAAGQIDPLTGEGIQYGMDAAQIAAETLAEAFAVGDFSAKFLRRYHQRWMKTFGWDFYWSRKFAQFYTKYPVFLDGCAELTRHRGTEFLAEWGKVMTGYRPKSYFLQPQVALPIVFETGRQWWKQQTFGKNRFLPVGACLFQRSFANGQRGGGNQHSGDKSQSDRGL